MRNELAENQAYEVVALVSNPASFKYLSGEFPGMDKLGLNPDNEQDKITADAIIFAINAGTQWQEVSDNSNNWGRLESMLRYGVVTVDAIKQALHTWYNTQ